MFLVDMVVIIVMQLLLEGASDGWRDMIIPALAISLGVAAVSFLLIDVIGLYVLAPMALLTFAILWLWCNMAPRYAIITAVVVLAIKLGISLVGIAVRS